MVFVNYMKKYKKEVINNMNKSLMVLVSDSWGIGAELNNPTGNIYVDHLQKKLGFDEILNLKDNPALCDGSHPNEFGHKVIADILYEHIKKHGMC